MSGDADDLVGHGVVAQRRDAQHAADDQAVEVAR